MMFKANNRNQIESLLTKKAKHIEYRKTGLQKGSSWKSIVIIICAKRAKDKKTMINGMSNIHLLQLVWYCG